VETTTGNTGQGAPAAVASSTAANVPSAARAYTLAELIDAFMASYTAADRSIGGRLDFWRRSLGARPAAAISADDVADALDALMQGSGRTFLGRDESGAPRFKPRGPIAGTTANRHLTSLGSVYKWARRRRLLPRGFVSPTRGVERFAAPNHRVRYLDDTERERLLAVCRVAAWSRLYLLVLMAISTGARRGELLSLKWRDIDLERKTASVATSKNGEPRVLALVAPVLAEIERHRSRRPEDYVFGSQRRPGRPMRIERAFRDACVLAPPGLPVSRLAAHLRVLPRAARGEPARDRRDPRPPPARHGEALRASLDAEQGAPRRARIRKRCMRRKLLRAAARHNVARHLRAHSFDGDPAHIVEAWLAFRKLPGAATHAPELRKQLDSLLEQILHEPRRRASGRPAGHRRGRWRNADRRVPADGQRADDERRRRHRRCDDVHVPNVEHRDQSY
jgi:integrase